MEGSGKCERLHGHTWKVELFVLAKNAGPNGMVIDYAVLKTALEHVTQKLDHSYLNEITEIGNPTSENIAKYIFGHVKQSLPEAPKLEKVRVWESPRSWCEYIE